MPETSLQICISKNEIFFDLICPNLNIVMNGHFYKDLGKVSCVLVLDAKKHGSGHSNLSGPTFLVYTIKSEK